MSAALSLKIPAIPVIEVISSILISISSNTGPLGLGVIVTKLDLPFLKILGIAENGDNERVLAHVAMGSC